jgi:alpha-L-rhamnosidase
VVDWIYRYLAGVAPDREQPGYRNVVVAPHPVARVEWARASILTGYGDTSVEWERDNSALRVEIRVPFGAHATVVLPASADSGVLLEGSAADANLTLGPGRHQVTVTDPIVHAPVASVP